MQKRQYDGIDGLIKYFKSYKVEGDTYGIGKGKEIDMSVVQRSLDNRAMEVEYLEDCKQVSPETLAGICCTL